jgi:hypothetical protein
MLHSGGRDGRAPGVLWVFQRPGAAVPLSC